MKNEWFTRENIAWAAGFFDGEGNIRFSDVDKKRSPRVFLQIAQVRPEPLEKFQSIFPVTNVRGPYQAKTPNRQPYYTYAVHTFDKVQFIAAALWEFLSEPKKEDVNRTIDNYINWMKDPKCTKGHQLLRSKGRTTMYCVECRTTAGLISAKKRWTLK